MVGINEKTIRRLLKLRGIKDCSITQVADRI